MDKHGSLISSNGTGLEHQLSGDEVVLRMSGIFPSVCTVIDRDPMLPSFFREKYHLYFVDLMQRLKVDMSILDYNYTRMQRYLQRMTEEHIYVFNLRADQVLGIDEKELPLALEFYLQFDGKSFE